MNAQLRLAEAEEIICNPSSDTPVHNAAKDAFLDILTLADSSQKRTLYSFEKELWTKILALGRAIIMVFLHRQTTLPRLTEYKHNGYTWEISNETRASDLGTKYGKVKFVRPIGRKKQAKRDACDLPIDRELGLCGGFSFGVAMIITRLSVQMAFGAARQNFRDIFEWAPAQKAVLRMVDAVGKEARVFLEQSMAPTEDGEILVIQVDGKGARRITPEAYKRRCKKHEHKHAAKGSKKARKIQKKKWIEKRKKKSKSKNAKVAVVGAIYTVRATKNGFEGPIEKRLYGTFKSHEALFKWLRVEADKRGYENKRTLFLSDGADAIWRQQEKYFPKAEGCLDWCHVMEKLWKAGEKTFGKQSKYFAEWIEKLEILLSKSNVDGVLRELMEQLDSIPIKGPGSKKKRKFLNKAIQYLKTHSKRIKYAELSKEGLEIGSGVIEGAVKNLVGTRIDGPGMQWGGPRSELVLHLRCILLNGQWDQFVDYLATKQIRLEPQPIRAIPHLAKAAA